jgi:septal ring factor EnvC (AmiA/AmiB activator)
MHATMKSPFLGALPETASKADELAHWQTFLGQLPPCSYLALYLNGSTPILEDAMRNDMSTELIPALRRARAEAQEDVREVKEQLRQHRDERETLQREIAGLKRDAVRLRDSFEEARSAARVLLRQAEDSHARGVNAIVRANS